MNTVNGNSGAPIILSKNNKYYIIGIHKGKASG